ncbi:MAG: glycosyltransferase family 4 protein [Bacteroidales bacterium]|nr:glycosyltransferase family 4 protein [Bacteroidales bacterium]
MRIAVNTRLLLKGRLDGIGWFTHETLRRIVVAHPEHEFLFFFDREPAPEFVFADNVRPVVLFPPTRHPVLWYLFFEFSVPRAIRKYKADMLLSPDGWIPLKCKVPTLNVIHDLNFEHFPDFLSRSHQRYFKHFFPKFARNATRLATVSEFSKRDIADTYGVPLEKIDVVYNGSHAHYHPYPDEVKRQIRDKYTNGSPYFIFVGTILKRKNLDTLFAAFDNFKGTDTTETKLLVVGSRKWWKGDIENAYLAMRHKSDVIFAGRVDADLLGQMMSTATALAYVSYFEGFGIPIVEAFCAETPVITANVTSMPEVAGDAALLVNPHSATDIAEALHKISADSDLRHSLVERGRLRRQNFGWDKTAELLWQSLTKTIEMK